MREKKMWRCMGAGPGVAVSLSRRKDSCHCRENHKTADAGSLLSGLTWGRPGRARRRRRPRCRTPAGPAGGQRPVAGCGHPCWHHGASWCAGRGTRDGALRYQARHLSLAPPSRTLLSSISKPILPGCAHRKEGSEELEAGGHGARGSGAGNVQCVVVDERRRAAGGRVSSMRPALRSV